MLNMCVVTGALSDEGQEGRDERKRGDKEVWAALIHSDRWVSYAWECKLESVIMTVASVYTALTKCFMGVCYLYHGVSVEVGIILTDKENEG